MPSHRSFPRLLVLLLFALLQGTLALAAFCAQCGAKLPPKARFCPACGARVGSAATPADATPHKPDDAALETKADDGLFAEPELRDFIHPVHGFGCTPPAGWKAEPYVQGVRLVGAQAIINIAQIETASTPAAYLQATEEKAGLTRAAQRTRHGACQVAGRAGVRAVYATKPGAAKPRIMAMVVAPADQGLFLVGLDAPASQGATALKTFDALVSSLRADAESAAARKPPAAPEPSTPDTPATPSAPQTPGPSSTARAPSQTPAERPAQASATAFQFWYDEPWQPAPLMGCAVRVTRPGATRETAAWVLFQFLGRLGDAAAVRRVLLTYQQQMLKRHPQAELADVQTRAFASGQVQGLSFQASLTSGSQPVLAEYAVARVSDGRFYGIVAWAPAAVYAGQAPVIQRMVASFAPQQP